MVISTATVNLQQQLMRKDLPAFSAALAEPIRFIQIKGRRRYLCPSRLEQLVTEPQQTALDLDVDEKYQNAIFQAQGKQLWQQWESNQWDGDRDHCQLPLQMPLWQQISTDSEGCAGKSCRFYQTCPYYVLRRALTQAHVAVVNHDVILSDADLGGGLVLPPPEEMVLVFDEAHNLPRKALDHAAKTLDFMQLEQMLESAEKMLKKLPTILAYRTADFGYIFKESRSAISACNQHLQSLQTLLADTDMVSDMLRGELSEPRIFADQPLFSALSVPMIALMQQANTLYKHVVLLGKWLREGMESLKIPARVGEAILPQVGTVQNLTGYLLDFVQLFLAEQVADKPPNVLWLSLLQTNQDKRLLMHAGPMTAADFLAKTLWYRAYGVVITSATLRGMGRFQRFRHDCGLYQYDSSYFLAVPSPFKYQQQATLNLPAMRYLPSESPQEWQIELSEKLPDLVDLSSATLVLFTSKVVMQFVYQRLPKALTQVILMQGEGLTAKRMIEKHCERVESGLGSVLFGLDSFAEGVDLPGDLCTHVIITRLPFPVFTRPIEQARQEWIIAKGGRPFTALSLPAVSVKLIQACGRLLRKETDYGNITILDRRLLTKGYGRQLLASLPDYRLERH
ncbi:ATP-dependent helicase DinG/Rad3 [Methylophaga frappieri]|uniref:ATP-dependent helicase DinG/Rad3 n=1 Tax=Methylophaga frappieri (strain ATCC BAA-2434 / DSM 25690 / JAM7) TaxID=754477 RepID=I1YLH7_METFJ|nr:ATP-dependent DNA helicase DinG [Methylophaga frappieri]AFJ03770.1 ATP-dependent helicase DinG/Rad3 [Methylophaga frappieri]